MKSSRGELPPVVILGAGHGRRLGEYGLRVPKVLAEVHNRPLLAIHLEHLAAEGFARAVINAHHLASQIIAFAATYDGPVALTVVREGHLLGTAGGVANAWQVLDSDRAVVVYGDVLPGPSLREMLNTHYRRPAIATLAAYRGTGSVAKGMIEIDATGRVTHFREKDPSARGGCWINAGLMVVERCLLDAVPFGRAVDFGDEVLPSAVARGEPLQVHRLPHAVIDIGTPDSLRLANRLGSA